MKYESNRYSDFWEKFRTARPHAVSLGVSDPKRFAAEAIFVSLGYNLYSAKECKAKPSEYAKNLFANMSKANVASLTRCAYFSAIEAAKRENDLAAVKRLEDALLANQPLRFAPNSTAYVDVLMNFMDADSLWFHQKVFICYLAAKNLFLPDRSYQQKEKRWNRERTYQHEETITYYKCGVRHTCLLSEKDWNTGCRNTVLDYFVDAYAREVKEINFEKVDFSCFRDLFGSDYERVIDSARSVLLAEEFAKLNAAISTLDSVGADVEKEKVLYLKLRDPVRRWIRTNDEEFYIAVWDNASWRLHWADMAVGSFLMKILG